MITKCLVQLLEYTLPPSAKSPQLPEFCLFCQSFVNAIVPPWSGERGGGSAITLLTWNLSLPSNMFKVEHSIVPETTSQ